MSSSVTFQCYRPVFSTFLIITLRRKKLESWIEIQLFDPHMVKPFPIFESRFVGSKFVKSSVRCWRIILYKYQYYYYYVQQWRISFFRCSVMKRATHYQLFPRGCFGFRRKMTGEWPWPIDKRGGAPDTTWKRPRYASYLAGWLLLPPSVRKHLLSQHLLDLAEPGRPWQSWDEDLR